MIVHVLEARQRGANGLRRHTLPLDLRERLVHLQQSTLKIASALRQFGELLGQEVATRLLLQVGPSRQYRVRLGPDLIQRSLEDSPLPFQGRLAPKHPLVRLADQKLQYLVVCSDVLDATRHSVLDLVSGHPEPAFTVSADVVVIARPQPTGARSALHHRIAAAAVEQPAAQDVGVAHRLRTVVVGPPVRRHEPLDREELLLVYDARPHGVDQASLVNWRLTVDLLLANVGRVLQHVLNGADRERCARVVLSPPGRVGLGAIAVRIESGPGLRDRAAIQVGVEAKVDGDRLLGVQDQVALPVRVEFVSQQLLAAVPQASLGADRHGFSGPFRSLLPLELSKGDHHRYEQPAMRGGGVVVLLEADELRAVLVNKFEEVQEVLDRARDAIESGAEDCVDPPRCDVGEQPLELHASQGVLARDRPKLVDRDLDPLLAGHGPLVLDVLTKTLDLVLEGAFFVLGLALGADSNDQADAPHRLRLADVLACSSLSITYQGRLIPPPIRRLGRQ